ncbi:MAG: benzoate-CoA ligase family protein [Caldilineaceae bacterium]
MTVDLSFPPHYNASELLFQNLHADRRDRIAIYWEEETYTYAQLCEMAGRFGNALKSLGIPVGSRILMLVMDTPYFPAVFFGSMRAGYIPIPTNTVLHGDAYLYLLQDSGAKAMIVSQPLYPKIAAIRDQCPQLEHVIVIGEEGTADTLSYDEIIAAATRNLDPAPTTPTDPAFMLYSSGSTGFPKGIVHLHRNIRYTTASYAQQVLGITPEDICFSPSKAFHAYGLGNSVTFPCSVGASAVLLTGRPTPARVFATIARFRPTLFFTAPTLYAALLAAYDETDMSSIRRCVSAAEALPQAVCRQWKARFGIDILDGIGTTEMLHIFISNRPEQIKAGSSGYPVPGYQAKIVDETGVPVRQGETGDLLVKGDSAAACYWHKPEKTKATMRGDWVFTGDRYYQDTEGAYYYEGRSDDMFKVSGQWVSPIEVENTLIEHPAVFECAVVGATNEQGLQCTKAFIVWAQGIQGDDTLTQTLQDHVKSRIAPYKYPRIVVYRDELPKTATGKIQRFLLRG